MLPKWLSPLAISLVLVIYFASMLILGMRLSFMRWNSRKAVVRRKPLPPEGIPS